MKVLVTGARGFVGRNVVETLKSHSGVTVLSPSRAELDLLSDDSVSTYVANEKPNVIIHLAGESNPWNVGRLAMFDVNVMGTLRLIDSLEKHVPDNLPRSFVFASAGYVYGPSTPGVVDEEVLPRPNGDYAVSKYCAEQIVAAVNGGIRVVSARLFNVIGVGHSEKYVVPKIAAAFRRGDAGIELGNTIAVRDFVDVRDVAAALVHLGLHSDAKGVFNICSGAGTSIGALIDLMRELSGRDLQVSTQSGFARPGDNMHLVGSNNRLRATGFSPRHSLRDSISWMLSGSDVS